MVGSDEFPGSPGHGRRADQAFPEENGYPMKPHRSIRMAALAALTTLVLTAGCATGTWFYQAYEYRYRVFESQKPMPRKLMAPIVGEAVANRFLQMDALNRSIDLLSTEGFELWKIERIPGTGYYTFTFRRSLPQGLRPTIAPMEFTGVYRATPPTPATTFYALIPRHEGYTAYIFNEGEPAPRIIDLAWNRDRLVAHEGNIDHTFMLSGDGLVISHIEEHMLPERLKRYEIIVRRVQP